ncbi:very short patch repair endonuclease [Melaminivora suipulveris]|uniref:Very short patch repair endonuclease n=1 Tax=Melaminivora suipulveris TaxID=2109913 RepID=A0A2R3QB84_9BURK|nr:DNA mismatch endonuclease Vsr [Melaminivora suipulveris]AVO48907.1 very short patch repair endonuclease [Melaminivora suipulveris]
MDTLNPEERSERMRRIRAKNTVPEMVVRGFVHALGFRYRLHDKNLPGCPDLVFPARHKVILVHGCFWHRHNRCPLARLPKSRLDFWLPKLEGNKRRDALKLRQLSRLGWKSLVIWECELRDPMRVMFKTLMFLED